MSNVRYFTWKEGNQCLGYLEAYPEYQLQGETLEVLESRLMELYSRLSGSVRAATAEFALV